MTLPADFDVKAPTEAHIQALQAALNMFDGLGAKPRAPLELTGKMDDATRAAWKAFKSEEFTDGQLSIGYMKDRGWIDDAWLDANKIDKDPRNFDRNNPRAAMVALAREKLGIPADAALTEDAFGQAVKKEKRAHWIDDRLNAGALKSLDESVARRTTEKAEMKTMTGGYAALAEGDFGTGAATLQAFLNSEKGGSHGLKEDGLFGDRTKNALQKYQHSVSARREAEGLPPIEADGVMGPATFAEMKKDGFSFADTEEALLKKDPQLMQKLEVLDRNRDALKNISQAHTNAGGSRLTVTDVVVVGTAGGQSPSQERTV
jgi:peptidoglycan hydrolase-like protein with peptidoglycan-binding domain